MNVHIGPFSVGSLDDEEQRNRFASFVKQAKWRVRFVSFCLFGWSLGFVMTRRVPSPGVDREQPQ